MVKKSSFLEKLFRTRKSEDARTAREQTDRSGTVRGAPSGRRAPPQEEKPSLRATAREVKAALEGAKLRGIDAEPSPPRTEAPAAEPQEQKKVNGDAKELVPEVVEPAEAKTGGLGRVLGGRREEAVQALTDGFRDLSGLLQGLQQRMDDQGTRADNLNDKFADLPAMAKAQVDFMSKVSQQLVEQKEKTSELLTKLGGLPDLLDGIHKTLEKQATVEERTEKNLKDFRSTMDRIHSSIGQLTKESQKAVKETTESFERSHSRTTQVFEDTQKQAYETFRRTQESHLTQLTQIVDKTGRMNRGIVILLVLVFASLVGLFGVMLGQ